MTPDRTARAHVEYDPMRAGVRIAVSPRRDQVIQWPALSIRTAEPESAAPLDGDDYLRLDDEVARALYEALATYFGGSGHDTRALRKDYDAERARVDQFIAHLTQAAR